MKNKRHHNKWNTSNNKSEKWKEISLVENTTGLQFVFIICAHWLWCTIFELFPPFALLHHFIAVIRIARARALQLKIVLVCTIINVYYTVRFHVQPYFFPSFSTSFFFRNDPLICVSLAYVWMREILRRA